MKKNMKKICFLIANLSGKGGTERVTCYLASALTKNGYEVDIISCQGSSSNYSVDLSVKIKYLNAENVRNPIVRKVNNIYEIYKYVKKRQIDYIIAVDIYIYLYLLPVQLFNGTKCIAWEHFNYYISSMKSSGLARKMASVFADQIVVLGKQDLENYKKNYKNIHNIRYIYNPVNFNSENDYNIDSKEIIAVGRLTNQKGFDRLIDIWNIIEHKNNVDGWNLKIYGEGELKDDLQEKINEYGLSNIKLMGYTENIEKVMENAAIFLLTSRYEGFVLVLIEALTKKIPCISFDCKEGPREIIDNGVNGYIVEDDNIDKYAEKLYYLMSNNKVRKTFSANSQKDLYRFDIDRVIKEWIKLFEEL